MTVPAVDGERAHAIVLRRRLPDREGQGRRPGVTLGEDPARVAAVREVLGPDGRIRVDANGAWSVRQAVDAIGLLDAAAGGLEYVEQPCRTLDELAVVRGSVRPSDRRRRSIRRASDPAAVAAAGAADIAVIKVAPLGGVRAALRIAVAVGLPVVVSRRWTPRSAWPRVWRWPLPCPSCPTPVVWARPGC